jgi:hypothetical protein
VHLPAAAPFLISQAPKNPITGEPLTPVTNKDKEGYQASTLAGQTEDTKARIFGQLEGQPGGRPFGSEACVCCCRVWCYRLVLCCWPSCAFDAV